MATIASKRRDYQYLVSILNSMKQISGSKIIHDIVTDWRIRYNRRSAMIDE